MCSSDLFVIERAKQAQVPKHVIDKAIDKAKGGGDETFVQGRYEGFGPKIGRASCRERV